MISFTSPQTPPPALTWTHLFATDTRFDCPGGPDWFKEQLAALPSTANKNAHVLWHTADGSLDHIVQTDGVVAINCRNFPNAQLHSAGYAYQRHFAVIPSLRHARWFVPLDAPALSSAGLSLYTPSRWSAKFTRGAMRLAMHSGLPIWYRDHIWIAQHESPPIEAAINPLFGGQGVRWALSSGAPEGARNRKASALALSLEGEMLGFAKLARSPIARNILTHEAAVLEQLAKQPDIAPTVPKLLFSGEIDEILTLVQAPLPGGPAPLPFSPAHEAFLRSLQTPVMVNGADTSMASSLQSRLDALSTPRPQFVKILRRVLAELGKFEVPKTIVHGDFAPWNLRADGGRVMAFDWEYGELHGMPLIDEIHYRLQTGWLLAQWSTQEALQCLDALTIRRPLGLHPSQVEAICSLHLLDMLARLFGEGYDETQDVVAWHARLLQRLDFRASTSHMEALAA